LQSRDHSSARYVDVVRMLPLSHSRDVRLLAIALLEVRAPLAASAESTMHSASFGDHPAVSVVIPAYRASRDIPDALASIFRQTFTDFEVIVVNDGCPDTAALVAALAPYSSSIRYIAQTNRGAAAARNTGVRAARGRFIAFLDADDVWLPGFLGAQVRLLEQRPARALVYCDATITGESALAHRRFSEGAPSIGPLTLLALVEQRCNIMLSTVVVRRDPLLAVGGFDETIARGHDADLWFRLALSGAWLHYNPAVLAERRVRAEGLSGNRISELRRAVDVLDRFGRRHDLPTAERTAVRVRIMRLRTELDIEEAKQRLVQGDFDAARQRLARHHGVSLKLRAVSLALRIAPRLFRRAYLVLRREAGRISAPPPMAATKEPV
jgi:glycosyltransferase involved in cell wall biosynthesis